MKNLAVFLTLALIVNTCFPKQESSESNVKQDYKKEKNNIKTEIRNNELTNRGPSGIGDLKLGMSKSDVEALQQGSDTYFTSPFLEPSERPSYFPEDIKEYLTELKITLSIKPIKTKLTFRGNLLYTIELDLKDDESVYKNILGKITEKYGAGSVKNTRKKELCLYKGGANFEIETGSIRTTWLEDIGQNTVNMTLANDNVYRRCPDNLMYDSVRERISYSIIFYGGVLKPKDIF